MIKWLLSLFFKIKKPITKTSYQEAWLKHTHESVKQGQLKIKKEQNNGLR